MGRHTILLDDHTADPVIVRVRPSITSSAARELHIDPRDREQITATIAAGRKLAAVRAYRRLTGAGFFAARRAVGLWATT